MQIKNWILSLLIIIMLISFVSAGVGIKWDQESALVNEGEKTCLTYSIYNPWPENTYVVIEPSEEFKDILLLQDVKSKLIPADTKSTSAIPVEFCFKIPEIYEKDCWIGNIACKQECKEEQKEYSGKIIVKSVPPPTEIGGSGGSATTMSVSAPLRIKIRCSAHSRDFTIIYLMSAIISLLVIGFILYKKYRRPKIQRDKERLKKLQEEIKKEERKRK